MIRHARRPSLCCKSLCTNIIWPLFVSLELFESSKPLRRTFALFCPCLFSRSRFLLLVCMHALILLARPMCMWCKQLLFGAYPTKARGKKKTQDQEDILQLLDPCSTKRIYSSNWLFPLFLVSMDFISIWLEILIIGAVFFLNSLILTVTFASIHTSVLFCHAYTTVRHLIP